MHGLNGARPTASTEETDDVTQALDQRRDERSKFSLARCLAIDHSADQSVKRSRSFQGRRSVDCPAALHQDVTAGRIAAEVDQVAPLAAVSALVRAGMSRFTLAGVRANRPADSVFHSRYLLTGQPPRSRPSPAPWGRLSFVRSRAVCALPKLRHG